MRTTLMMMLWAALAAGCGPTSKPTPTRPPAAAAPRTEAPTMPGEGRPAPRPAAPPRAPAPPPPAAPGPSPLDELARVTPAPDEPAPPAGTAGTAVWRVVAVADGDTVTAIDQANDQIRIRLAGIDAPETAQPFGTVARRRLAELVMRKTVNVIVEGTDRYGRTVARLEVDGLDVCRQMVADGLAWHYRRYSSDETLAAAEAAARAAGRGLWRDADPVAPWEWRAAERERKGQAAAK